MTLMSRFHRAVRYSRRVRYAILSFDCEKFELYQNTKLYHFFLWVFRWGT